MSKISVIVPIYNSELFLSKCIESIINQTFDDFELLLINDGSTDSSKKICEKYAQKDSRIKVYNKINEGISATREFGIIHACGEYILFIDSDDWIDKQMLQCMIQKAINTNADIVGCNFYEIYKDKKILQKTFYISNELFTKDIIKGYWGVVWKILVKHELYTKNNIHFPQNINGGEDYFVCVKLFTSTTKIVCINQAFYYYNRCNENSIMSSYSRKKVQEQIDATILTENYLKTNNILEKYKEELNIRKFNSKLPLIKKSPWEWIKIFPESNQVYKKLKLNWKTKALAFMLSILK
ncbi:glycosyltransferase [Phocaeicola barnesiae]|uniref:glycosyltransferase family 2 protein n=1 Tax=Phocaeicola barnesiae TaxID=376804 RepID=UPI0025A36C86|nr:glycosyltransferase [Phocaeicola barnesiae]MDM8234662.1 glycosyltransferase [Phocaeicola barnesiae]